MSALGQKRTKRLRWTLSALPPKADIASLPRNVRLADRAFKYVGVAGVDKPWIVQVGVAAENLADCK
jgi:hypothetical protein